VANEHGPAAAYLLCVIALQEDAIHYQRPVAYWDEQLMPIVGVRSRYTLCRIRRALVEAGWLHYIPGNRGRPARYWVTIPPAAAQFDDSAIDAGDHMLADILSKTWTANAPSSHRIATENAPNPRTVHPEGDSVQSLDSKRTESAQKTHRNRTETAQKHPTLSTLSRSLKRNLLAQISSVRRRSKLRRPDR